MAVTRWRERGTGESVLLLLALLCCVSFSHGRNIGPAGLDLSSRPRTAEVREFQLAEVWLDSDFDGIVVTARMRGDVEFLPVKRRIPLPVTGEISRRIDDSYSDRQSENRFVSVTQGQKWKRTLGNIAEWLFHACVVVLAVYAVLYTLSCIVACCIGLDLLAEIWRTLGEWQAFNYFVRVEQAMVETDPEPLPLLRSTAQP